MELKICVPTFGKLAELKKLGFDLGDITKTNAAYISTVQDPEKLKTLSGIILEEPLTDEQINTTAVPAVKKALNDFLAECGLLII